MAGRDDERLELGVRHLVPHDPERRNSDGFEHFIGIALRITETDLGGRNVDQVEFSIRGRPAMDEHEHHNDQSADANGHLGRN